MRGWRTAAIALACLLLALLTACELWSQTPTAVWTPTAGLRTPTPSATPTRPPVEQELYRDYARGEIMPDMRVPIQRSESGEGGWYTIIGTAEGWAQFLSQMGQPAEIWQPVAWEQELLIGALLGARVGRGHEITIRDLTLDGVSVEVWVEISAPAATPPPTAWIVYPFHLIRVPRDELPLGPMTFEFFVAAPDQEEPRGEPLVSQTVDTTDLNLLWLPGEASRLPTPVAVAATSTPQPTLTATPVPNVQVNGTVLDISAVDLRLRLLTAASEELRVDLMQATSILSEEGQTATLSQIVPGTTIAVLGYEGGEGNIRAAHIDLVSGPIDTLRFAIYRPRDVQLSTLYTGFELPLPVEAVSTTVPLSQTFGPTGTRMLAQNGFLVVPGEYQSFEALYSDPLGADQPLLISADAVLHTTHRALHHVRRTVEGTHLLSELRLLDRRLFERSWSHYEERAAGATQVDQRIASTALRSAAYFAVPLSVLDPAFTPPEVLSTVVSAELALIEASEAITISPAMAVRSVPEEEQLRIDYRSFSLLGSPPEEWARYRTALQWHRAVVLRPTQREETRTAALIAWLLDTDPAANVLWQRIQSTVGFIEGRDASYTPDQYAGLLQLIWEESADISVLADEEGLDALTNATVSLPMPDHPLWAFWSRAGMPERVWRFLAGPFCPGRYILSQTVGDEVGAEGYRRDLPSYVDLGAVIGAMEAYRVAEELGAAEYAGYLDQIGRVRNELASLAPGYWAESLDWNWLYTHASLVREKTNAYPSWMRSSTWRRQELRTMLGSWTWVRHAAGQPAAALPEGEGETPAPTTWGYLQPQPELYARLAALTRLLTEGLEERLMLAQADRVLLLDLEAWLTYLQDVARRELTGQALAPDDYERLGGYATVLAEFDAVIGGAPDVRVALQAATGETAQLIEALGPVDVIYLVVEREGVLYLARGGTYRHYEFRLPLDEPVADDSWRAQLAAGEAPELPAWADLLVE